MEQWNFHSAHRRRLAEASNQLATVADGLLTDRPASKHMEFPYFSPLSVGAPLPDRTWSLAVVKETVQNNINEAAFMEFHTPFSRPSLGSTQ